MTDVLLKLKRINLQNTFKNQGDGGGTLIGQVSGATAMIVNTAEDLTLPVIGLNATVSANVQTANNVATKLDIFDSGYGYSDFETVTLTKPGSNYEITAIAQIKKQGSSEGFYLSTQGFLDSDKKLHDNNYYQNYSYEVLTKIPFEQYSEVLKKIMHVAGTRAFGRVVSTSQANVKMSVINTITLS